MYEDKRVIEFKLEHEDIYEDSLVIECKTIYLRAKEVMYKDERVTKCMDLYQYCIILGCHDVL